MKRLQNRSAGITTIFGALAIFAFAATAGSEHMLTAAMKPVGAHVEECLKNSAAALVGGSYSCGAPVERIVSGARFVSAPKN